MNFKHTVCFCLNFIKKSLQMELDEYMELLDEELEKPITKQAFSKARQHISPEAFKSLFYLTCETLFHHASKKYKGYRVYAIDGTDLALSRSKELALHYPPAPSRMTAPRARVSLLYDVLNDYIVHGELQSVQCAERTLARNHLTYYQTLCPARSGKELFLFDRGYPSKDLVDYLERNNWKYVMRLQKSFNPLIDRSHKNDFYLKLAHKQGELTIRVIKLLLSSGEEEVLITNLGRKAFGHCEFQALYFLRWGIETKYNTLKNKYQLEDFSGKTVVSVLQDFYATLYLSNLASAIKRQTDAQIEEHTKSRKLSHHYQTNENLLIGKLKHNLVLILLCDEQEKRDILLNKLVERISSFRTAVIPNRHFPRPTEAHKKTRSKTKRAF